MKYFIKYSVLVINLIILHALVSCNSVKVVSSNGEYESIFDGQSLSGWEGDSIYWRVENGNLVGEVTPATILDRNSFIIWKNGITKDFEFKAEYRISEDGNSGINYRSQIVDGVSYALVGYQCDIDGKNWFTGMNYEERKRTTLANPGKVVVIEDQPMEDSQLTKFIKNNQWLLSKDVGNTGEITFLKSQIKTNDWNSVHIIVKGNRMQHFINGNLMSDVTDNDIVNRSSEGLLGVQVHVGPPMKIEYRNMMIKHTN